MNAASSFPNGHHSAGRTGALCRSLVGAAVAATALVVPVAASSVAAEDPGVDCAEYDADHFTADVDRLNPYIVRPILTYDDPGALDVCPYTVFFSLRDGDGDVVFSSWVSMSLVESETESAAGAFKYLIPHEGCDWELWVSVEESLPIVLDSPDFCVGEFGFTFEPVAPIRPVAPWFNHTFTTRFTAS